MGPPRVSVVLPTHNRRHSLGRAAASVLAQTFEDLELIIVDDGSTDGTDSVIAAIDDARLVTVRLRGRNGAAVARNAGIELARGTLIGFQDSDDEWLATKVADQVALLDLCGDDVGAVGGTYIIATPDGSTTIRSRALETAQDYECDLLEGPCCITPVWLVRRHVLEQVGGFDVTLPCLEDWDLLLRLSGVTSLAAVAAPVLVKYGSPDSLGADIGRRREALTAIQQRHGERWQRRRRDDAKLCLELAYLNVVQRRPVAAARHLARGVGRRSVGPRDLVHLARACVQARRWGPECWPPRG